MNSENDEACRWIIRTIPSDGNAFCNYFHNEGLSHLQAVLLAFISLWKKPKYRDGWLLFFISLSLLTSISQQFAFGSLLLIFLFSAWQPDINWINRTFVPEFESYNGINWKKKKTWAIGHGKEVIIASEYKISMICICIDAKKWNKEKTIVFSYSAKSRQCMQYVISRFNNELGWKIVLFNFLSELLNIYSNKWV